jgi:hypothetical protein
MLDTYARQFGRLGRSKHRGVLGLDRPWIQRWPCSHQFWTCKLHYYRYISHLLLANSFIQALKQEATWAAHLGLPSVLLPVLPSSTISNFARVMCGVASILPYAQVLIRVPMSKGTEATGWLQWNNLYNLTEQHPKLHVGKVHRVRSTV